MNGRQQGRGGHGEDPVGEFFAAHREQVRDEPADDLTWHRIRETRHRARSGRRGAWTGALVAAAAALAIVIGPSLLPDTEEPDVAGPVATSSDPTGSPGTPTDTASETPTDEEIPDPLVVTTPVPEGALPADGQFTDVTTADPVRGADTGVRYAAVLHPCATSGWCTVLGVSEDGGTTWAPRADLEQLGMVHRVLFTDHGRGWVWGDKAPLWTTTDGGRTWTQVENAPDYVADLDVQGDELLATTWTYAKCPEGSCLPTGAVVLTDPTDIDWTDDVTADLGPVERATIIDSGDVRYVVTRGADGLVRSLLRLQDGQLEPTAELSDCAGPVALAGSGTPGPGVGWDTGVYALCDDDSGLALQSSPNGGRSWAPSNLTVPTFVLGEEPPLMASRWAGQLLLIGEGNYTVTTDGGQTWSEETFLPGASSRPEGLEVTMFGEVIAYPTQEQALAGVAYWHSGDGGVTWETVDLP